MPDIIAQWNATFPTSQPKLVVVCFHEKYLYGDSNTGQHSIVRKKIADDDDSA